MQRYSDIDLEKQVATELIKNSSSIEEILSAGVDSDCFVNKKARQLFNWAKARYLREEPIGPVSAQKELGNIEEIVTDFGLVPGELDEVLHSLIELRENRREAGARSDLVQLINDGASPEEIRQKLDNLQQTNQGDWPDPLPFTNYNVFPLPVDILPEWLQDFAANLAEFTQTPVDMGIMLIIAALGTALANKAVIEVRPGYTEPLNIWTCTVLPAGNRKSPVFKKVMAPILDYEERKREEIEPERRHALKERSILEDQLKQKEKQAGNTKEDLKRKQVMQEIFNLDDEIQEMDIPALPRLVASDVTTEKLALLMAENNGRIAILSPEGDIFKMMAGRYANNGLAAFENYKKAWTGGEVIRDDRMGREGTYVRNPALTMGLTVQPIVLEDLKEKKAFQGEGILGRFLYAIPESTVGSRKIGDEVPELSELAVMRYKKGLHVLLNLKPAEEDENKNWNFHIIKLSSEALKIRNDFDREIEKELGSDGELNTFPDWGSKLVGNMTRVAGLLHLAGMVDAQKGQAPFDIWDRPITQETMKAAVRLGRALVQHALKIYDLLDTDPEIELARYVLKRIQKGIEMEEEGELHERFEGKQKLDKAVLYKLTRKKKEIKKPNDLEKPLKILEELNYIQLLKQVSEGPGRPPAPVIKLNPKVGTLFPLNTLNVKETEKDLPSITEVSF